MAALPDTSMPTSTAAEAGVFLFPVTVRYMEVDGQGVVFNGWYLTYFDEAMNAFLAHRGLMYQTMQRNGYELQTVRTEIDYRAGVRWGDPIVVAVSPSRYGRTSLTLDFQVRRGAAPDAEVTTNGRIVYVVINVDDHTKREIPEPLRAALGEARPLH